MLDDDCVTGFLLHTYIQDICNCCTNDEVLSTNTFVYYGKNLNLLAIIFTVLEQRLNFLELKVNLTQINLKAREHRA